MNASAKHTPNVLIETPRTLISGCIASKVIQRVRDRAVDPHLEVQVRAEAATGAAGEADDLALADLLAQRDAERRLMRVAGGHRAGVLDAREVPVAARGGLRLQQRDAPGGRGVDRRSRRDADVDAGVAALPGAAPADRRGERAVEGPDQRAAAALDRAGGELALALLQRACDAGLLGL